MKLILISAFRDEAKYIKEWVEFHLMMGIDKIYLINNLSADNYLDILTPYITQGVVVVKNLNLETHNSTNSRENLVNLVNAQYPIMDKWIKDEDSDWIINLSVDEFLFPTGSETIKDVLSSFDDTVGEVLINWRNFGNSNYRLCDDDIMIEKLTLCSSIEHLDNNHVKFIVRKKAYHSIYNAHFVHVDKKYKVVDATGDPNNIKSNKYETIKHNRYPLTINHYKFRDVDWTEKKIGWYKIWGRNVDINMVDEYNIDENYDIQKYVPELKRRLNGKRSI